MADITTIQSSDQVSDSRTVINENFENLNTDKMEKSDNLSDVEDAAEALTNLGVQRIYKSANETVNNSAVLQNDDELILPVLANEVWAFTMFLHASSGATPDFKYTFSLPSGTTTRFFDAVFFNDFEEGETVVHGGGTNPIITTIMGHFTISSTPGNVVFQWAQNTQNASDTKVLKGSYIIAHKLA